jgi:RNA polymerase sigma factor (sigma-70 family)
MTDIELVALFNSNPIMGVEQSYKLYSSKIFAISINILNDKLEAEEVTQDVFLKVYSSISQFNFESKFSTWLCRMAINKSLDQLRKRKKKSNIFNISRFFRDEDLSRFEATSIQPSISIENQELSTILHQAIQKLPVSQGIAFTLMKIQGESASSAAELMGKSLSSVEALMVRANRNLRIILSDFYDKNYK